MYEANNIRADITVTNVNTYGLAKAQFLAVRPQHSDNYFKLELDVDLPKVLIEGNYKADGSLGTFQIGGEGMQINYFKILTIFIIYIRNIIKFIEKILKIQKNTT